jgi:hypothetical protein
VEDRKESVYRRWNRNLIKTHRLSLNFWDWRLNSSGRSQKLRWRLNSFQDTSRQPPVTKQRKDKWTGGESGRCG